MGQLVGEQAENCYSVNPRLPDDSKPYLICFLLCMPAGKKWVSWWVSRVSMCTADAVTLQPLSCSDYDPRSWRDEECMWSAGFESLGEQSAVCRVKCVVV
jgi:hypothetical protein